MVMAGHRVFWVKATFGEGWYAARQTFSAPPVSAAFVKVQATDPAHARDLAQASINHEIGAQSRSGRHADIALLPRQPSPDVFKRAGIQAKPPVFTFLDAEPAILANTPQEIVRFEHPAGRVLMGPVRGRSGSYIRPLWVRRPNGDLKLAGHPVVDFAGHLDRKGAIARLFEVGEGDRAGRRRSVMVDLGVKAGKVHELKDGSAFTWWMNPNETDVAKIDTPDSELKIKPGEGSPSTREAIGYLFIEGTAGERDKILDSINRNFTAAEKRHLTGLNIRVSSGDLARAGAAGLHMSLGGGRAQVILGKKFVTDDVITHELIHHLHDVDITRKGFFRGSGTDRDVEEIGTEVETIARYNPFERPDGAVGPATGAGYARFSRAARAGTKTAEEVQTGDRKVLTLRPGLTVAERRAEPAEAVRRSGKRGKRLLSRIEKDFGETDLATAKVHGRAEVIDTYYGLRNVRGQTVAKLQVYKPQPQARKDPDDFAKERLAPLAPDAGGQIVQYHDGRAQAIAKVPAGRLLGGRGRVRL